jgi:hypothetical protein
MALRELIVNTKNKEWHDAIWFYQWIKVDAQNSHLILLTYIPVVPKNVPFQHPNDYTWVKLDERFSSALQSCLQLDRILFMMGTTEAQIRRVVGEAIYAKETSPPSRPLKKTKAHGQFFKTQEEHLPTMSRT